MDKLFDVCLIENEVDSAYLTRGDLIELVKLSKTEQMIPLEVEGNASIAMGFIDYDAAESLDFLLDALKEFIAQILNGEMEESEDHTYRFTKLDVYIGHGSV